MDEKYMIELVGQLESDSEAILKTSETGTVAYKHAACQTTSCDPSEVIIPFMFCGMFSPMCEAATQVNLPVMPKVNLPVMPKVNLPVMPKVYLPVMPKVNRPIMPKVNLPVMPKVNRPIMPKVNLPVMPKVNLPVMPKRVRDSCAHPADTLSSDGESKDSDLELLDDLKDSKNSDLELLDDLRAVQVREECDEAQTMEEGTLEEDFVCSESLGTEEDVLFPLSPQEDYVERDPEDSEYSSDNDLAFWQKMKKTAKRKKKLSTGKVFLRNSSHVLSDSKKEQTECSSRNIAVQRHDGQEQSTSSKDDSKLSGSGDDWITDDEMELEDSENIDDAFRKEWKERRCPKNTKEKMFVCDICGRQYSKHSHLRKHVVRDHKEHEEAKRYPYCCPHCKNVYAHEIHLLKHQRQHCGPCEICGEMLPCNGLFVKHRSNHDSLCKICDREFKSKASLAMHIKVKHAQTVVPCPQCKKTFPFEFLLKRHVAKEHDKARPVKYKCAKCDFTAKTERAVKIHHKLIHKSKLDIYTCRECQAVFHSQPTFDEHVAGHASQASAASHGPPSPSEDESQSHNLSIHEVTEEAEDGKVTAFGQAEGSQVSRNLCALCNVAVGGPEDTARHMQAYHSAALTQEPDTHIKLDMDIEPDHLMEIDGKDADPSAVQEAGSETILQVLDKPIKPDHPMEIDGKDADPSAVQDAGSETILQVLDKPIKVEQCNVNYSEDNTGTCSATRTPLLMPASALPPNVNLVEINGVQYHVIRNCQ